MRPTDNIIKTLRNFEVKPDAEFSEVVIHKAEEAFGQAKITTHKQTDRESVWRMLMANGKLKFAAAAVIIIAAVVGISKLIGGMDVASVAWAEVKEHFKSVDHFKATVYYNRNYKAEPNHAELWVGQGGRVRLYTAGQIIFAENGEIKATYELKTKREATPIPQAKGIIRMLAGGKGGFSLENIISAVCGGSELVNTDSALIEDDEIASDLAVFDLRPKDGPEWMRIWVLRQSKLPIQLRTWDASSGRSADIIFTYSREPDAGFFSAENFAKQLSSTPSGYELSLLEPEDPAKNRTWAAVPNGIAIWSFNGKTIEGKEVQLENFRDKVLLIDLAYPEEMSTKLNSIRDEKDRLLKDMQERFGGRKDFAVISVAVGFESESDKAMLRSRGYSWTVLDEQGKWKNNRFVKALGAKGYYDGPFVVEKNGQIVNAKTSGHQTGVVEGSLIGLTWDSWYAGIFDKLKAGMSKREVLATFGEPNSKETHSAVCPSSAEAWLYYCTNEEKTRYIQGTVGFDANGKVNHISFGQSIVDAANLVLEVSGESWKNMLSELGELPPESTPALVLVMGNEHSPINEVYGSKKEAFVPGKMYLRQVIPGTYQLQLQAIMDSPEYRVVKTKIIAESITFGKNEMKKLHY
jgi:outer membrane lipoprotein-sorting protein